MVKLSDLQGGFNELSLKLQQSVKLEHLFALTDHNAVLQHAKFSVPARREGYTVDDNARALVFAAKAPAFWPEQRLAEMQHRLISFLLVMQADDGRFHNLMDFSQRIVDAATVGDHVGRALWATGAVISAENPRGVKASARLMFDRALPWARDSTSPRTKAYACLGLVERLYTDSEDSNLRANLRTIADSLVELYNSNRTPDWKWFENILSYDNPRLSQALFAAYESLGEKAYLEVAEESMKFLKAATTIDGIYVPIGSGGWYPKGGDRALYDQQPIEAGGMVETAALAYDLTRSEEYATAIRQAMGWFFGLNTKSVELYDDSTGACYDGINMKGVNENQGSESTLALLLAVVTFIGIFQKEGR
jgi:hypothetical protein